MDWRGQGLSDRALPDRRKGYIKNFSQYDTDLSVFMKEVVLPDCPPPYFALAHSMGSSPLLRAAQRGERWFDRMVFTSPLIGLAQTPFGRLSKPLARILRLLAVRNGMSSGAEDGHRRRLVCREHRDIGSGALRPQRRGARSRPRPRGRPATVAWADAAFRVMAQYATPGYARPDPPADPDRCGGARQGHRQQPQPKSSPSICGLARISFSRAPTTKS